MSPFRVLLAFLLLFFAASGLAARADVFSKQCSTELIGGEPYSALLESFEEGVYGVGTGEAFVAPFSASIVPGSLGDFEFLFSGFDCNDQVTDVLPIDFPSIEECDNKEVYSLQKLSNLFSVVPFHHKPSEDYYISYKVFTLDAFVEGITGVYVDDESQKTECLDVLLIPELFEDENAQKFYEEISGAFEDIEEIDGREIIDFLWSNYLVEGSNLSPEGGNATVLYALLAVPAGQLKGLSARINKQLSECGSEIEVRDLVTEEITSDTVGLFRITLWNPLRQPVPPENPYRFMKIEQVYSLPRDYYMSIIAGPPPVAGYYEDEGISVHPDLRELLKKRNELKYTDAFEACIDSLHNFCIEKKFITGKKVTPSKTVDLETDCGRDPGLYVSGSELGEDSCKLYAALNEFEEKTLPAITVNPVYREFLVDLQKNNYSEKVYLVEGNEAGSLKEASLKGYERVSNGLVLRISKESKELEFNPSFAFAFLLTHSNTDFSGDYLSEGVAPLSDKYALIAFSGKLREYVEEEDGSDVEPVFLDLVDERWWPYCSTFKEGGALTDFSGNPFSGPRIPASFSEAGLADLEFNRLFEALCAKPEHSCPPTNELDKLKGFFYSFDYSNPENYNKTSGTMAYIKPFFTPITQIEFDSPGTQSSYSKSIITSREEDYDYYAFFYPEVTEYVWNDFKELVKSVSDAEVTGLPGLWSAVSNEEVCVRYSSKGIEYYWNPAKVTEEVASKINPDTCGQQEKEGEILKTSKTIEGGCTPSSLGVADPDDCPESPTFQAALFSGFVLSAYTSTPPAPIIYAQESEEEEVEGAIYFYSKDECCCGANCDSFECYTEADKDCVKRYRGSKNYCGLNKCYECLVGHHEPCEKKFSKAYGVCGDWKCKEEIDCSSEYDCTKSVKDPLTGKDQKWVCVPGVDKCSVPCSNNNAIYTLGSGRGSKKVSKCEYFMGAGFSCNTNVGYCERKISSGNLRDFIREKLNSNPYARALYGDKLFEGIDSSLESKVLFTFGSGTKGTEFYAGLDYAKLLFLAVNAGESIVLFDNAIGRDVMLVPKVGRSNVLSDYSQGNKVSTCESVDDCVRKEGAMSKTDVEKGLEWLCESGHCLVYNNITGKKMMQTKITRDFLFEYPIEIYLKNRRDEWVLLDAAYGTDTWGDLGLIDLVLRRSGFFLLLDKEGVMIPNYKLGADSGIEGYSYFNVVDSGNGIKLWALYNHPLSVASSFVGGLPDVGSSAVKNYNKTLEGIAGGSAAKSWATLRQCHEEYNDRGYLDEKSMYNCTTADLDKTKREGVYEAHREGQPSAIAFTDECYSDDDCTDIWGYSPPVICKPSDGGIVSACYEGCDSALWCAQKYGVGYDDQDWACIDSRCIYIPFGKCPSNKVCGDKVINEPDPGTNQTRARRIIPLCNQSNGYCERADCCLYFDSLGSNGHCYNVDCSLFVDKWNGGNKMSVAGLSGDKLEIELLERVILDHVPDAGPREEYREYIESFKANIKFVESAGFEIDKKYLASISNFIPGFETYYFASPRLNIYAASGLFVGRCEDGIGKGNAISGQDVQVYGCEVKGELKYA